MATIAVAECLAMTGDESLRPAVERGVAHTLAMQHPATGGWRYAAGDRGDTSQCGWQVMVLATARNAGLGGFDAAEARARVFLQSVASGAAGGLAAYRLGERPSMAMTAEALYCRLVLGASPAAPATAEALSMISSAPPTPATANAYAWYYATVASFHAGGPQWDRWNAQLQTTLVSMQRRDGGPLGGAGVFDGALSSKTLWHLASDFARARRGDRGYDGRALTVAWQAIRAEVAAACREAQQLLALQLAALAQPAPGRGTIERIEGRGRFVGPDTIELSGGRRILAEVLRDEVRAEERQPAGHRLEQGHGWDAKLRSDGLAETALRVDHDGLFAVVGPPAAHRIIFKIEIPEGALDDSLENELPVLEIKNRAVVGTGDAFEKDRATVRLKSAGRERPVVIDLAPGMFQAFADGGQAQARLEEGVHKTQFHQIPETQIDLATPPG
jgi:hypothetical protein